MVDNAPKYGTAAGHSTRLVTDRATAQRLADFLTESLDEQNVVVAAFESDAGQWTAAVYFSAPPNETAIRALVALEMGAELANALVFERVEAKDWVAASLEGLAPVAAGRFLVHGRHDRARVRANLIGIEIEAALAFGTGHHGTTRGCLLALDHLVKRQQTKKTPTPTLPLSGEGRPTAASLSSPSRGEDQGGVHFVSSTSAPAPACSPLRRPRRCEDASWRATLIPLPSRSRARMRG